MHMIMTQKSDVGIMATSMLRQYFDQNSACYEPCRLHVSALKENENVLNNRRIALICNPALILYGDSEGLDAEIERVLKKAVVLMM